MRVVLGLALLGVACCGDKNPQKPDAGIDASTIDSGPCGADILFTGEYVDWDSTETTFCGIFNAKFTMASNSSRTDNTNPNGRFSLCLPQAATTVVNITPPTTVSECTVPKSTYDLPGIIIADKAVIQAVNAKQGVISARSLTIANAKYGLIDKTQAQVFVHVEGTLRAVSLSGTHDPAQAFNGTWAAGDTGTNVFFANVDPNSSPTVTVAGGAVGTGMPLPLMAGGITYVTVVAQ